MSRRTVAMLAVLAVVGLPNLALAASGGLRPDAPPGLDWAELPANDHARGLVFDGLRPAHPLGHCRGGFEIALDDGDVLCTHGPDAAPPGLDVRLGSAPAIAAEAGDGGATTTGGAAVPCIGDGVDGNRVQAVYAVPADRPDRFAEIAPQISGWAAEVDRVFDESAAQVGGERHVRFVTNPDCSLDVAHAVVSTTGDDSITNTINELKALGFDDPSRKYLVWMDATVYCGVGQLYNDDRPGPDNLHNGGRAMFARVDTACWGRTSPVEAHELVHTMGGVQPSAPHASANFHCTDEYDRMCYMDGADVVMTYDCADTNEGHLDCNHDDYYHPSPPAGSYLADHWNVADSSFLHAGPVGDPPPPGNTAPTVDAGVDQSVEFPLAAPLDGAVSDDGMPDGTLSTVWSVVSGPGEVTFADAASPSTSATFSAAGSYVLRLTADDGELAGDDTVTVICDEPPADPTNQAPVVSAGPDQVVDLGAAASLAGSADDDGLPSGELTVAWTSVSGPGEVTFADASAPITTATFSAAGTYVLELSASDSLLTSTDSVTVTVDEAPAGPTETTETFESSLNRKNPTRSYAVTTAGGAIDAVLTAEAQGRGKKAGTPPVLTLTVLGSTGELIGSATSPAEWSGPDLAAGTYTFVVSGATRASFTLELTYWS